MTGRTRPADRGAVADKVRGAILLAESYVEWVDALQERLAAAGWGEDAAYARALRELGRAHLALLRRSERELLTRGRPREGGVAFGAVLDRVLPPLRRD